VRECRIPDLTVGVILQQDIRTDTGLLVVAKGQELSFARIECLKDCWRQGSIPGRLLVQIPENAAGSQPIGAKPDSGQNSG
jgi:hypothetical protein